MKHAREPLRASKLKAKGYALRGDGIPPRIEIETFLLDSQAMGEVVVPLPSGNSKMTYLARVSSVRLACPGGCRRCSRSGKTTAL